MYKRAFTLIELLVVISIIALLAGVVLASLNTAREKGRLAAGKQFAASVDHIAQDQAVGMWDFADCSGSSVSDRSGNANVGTFMNMATSSWSTDTPTGSGCSIAFNGTNQYVAVPSSPSISAQFSTFSISLWYKKSTNNFGQFLGRQYAVWELQWRIFNQGPNLYINGVENGPYVSVPIDGKWHHLVMTFVDATNVVTYYLDGAILGTSVNAQSIPVSNNELNIGRRAVNGTEYWDGSLDAVHVFAKDLTASEVSKIYASEAPRYQTALR